MVSIGGFYNKLYLFGNIGEQGIFSLSDRFDEYVGLY